MTASVVAAIASIIASNGWHGGVDLLPSILYFLKLQLIGSYDDALINIETKYAILAFICTFAIGFLLFIGAIPISMLAKPKEKQNE